MAGRSGEVEGDSPPWWWNAFGDVAPYRLDIVVVVEEGMAFLIDIRCPQVVYRVVEEVSQYVATAVHA